MEFLFVLMERGGPVMWPLLVASLVSLTVTLERLLLWWREGRGRNPGLVRRIFECAEGGRFEEALELEGRADRTARVLLAGLRDRAHGLREGLEMAAEDEIERLNRGLGVLDTIVTMAPLLGILGTVTGIIDSFDLLGGAGVNDPRAVSGGIAEALITTAAGLVVSLATLVPYNYFVYKVRRAARMLGQTGTQFEIACRKGMGRESIQRA